MANRKRQRARRRLKPLPVVLAALVLVAIVVVAIVLIKKYSPTSSTTDYEYYYNLSYDGTVGRDKAAEDEMAIVMEGEILEERAVLKDGEAYVSMELLRDTIDSRLYYDSTEDLIIITNALHMVTAVVGESSYSVDGEAVSTSYEVAFTRDGTLYVSMSFFDEFSSSSHGVYEDPARVVITYKTGETTFCDATGTAVIRVQGGIKSNIVGKVEKGAKLKVLENLDDWLGVVSEEGWVGYVKTSQVSDTYTEDVASDYDEPEYTSLSLGETVKLGWGAVYVQGANDFYDDYTANAGDMNVYCPTWYFLEDTEGSVTMLSDSAYVNRAHEDGYLVWAMFSDAEYEYVESVVVSTTKRQAVIEAVVADMLANGIDGINVDFERITEDYGWDYIEFIRELSIRCRQEGLYLSTDNYAPYDSRSYYHIEEQSTLCDYVIIMEYDDYVGTGEAGPNSSLPFIEEVTDMAIAKVDASKLVVAIPFYTRIWYLQADDSYTSESVGMSTAWAYVNAYATDGYSWDDTLGMYYAEYTTEGETAYAWLEDAESIQAKLNLLQSYGIAGYAFWRLGQETSDVWTVIDQY